MTAIDDSRELLICVRYESRRNQPVEKAYESFCQIAGNEAMAYLDFDFWFHGFKNGKLDLDHDRSQDVPKPVLEDLPLDVMKEIFGNLEWKERAICRKVSKSLRNLIDNMKLAVEEISVFSYDDSISLDFKPKISIKYHKTQTGCYVEHGGKSKFINGADFCQMMCKDLKTVLINPKLRLEAFTFLIKEYPGNEDALGFLSSLGHQLKVKSVLLYAKNQDDVLKILPYVKPRVLEKIELWNYPFGRAETEQLKIDKVSELDQWRKAKRINAQTIIMNSKIEHFLHFNDIRAHIDAISKEDAIRLKNTILVSPDFESCRLKIESDQSFEDIIEIFGEENLPIPGSTSDINVDYEENNTLVLTKSS